MFVKKSNKSIQRDSLEAMPFEECLAKTYRSKNNENLPGRTVFDHCHIVGEVARAIMARTPDWLRKKLFPYGSELAAAAHDIGRLAQRFRKKYIEAQTATTGIQKKNLSRSIPSWKKLGVVMLALARPLL